MKPLYPSFTAPRSQASARAERCSSRPRVPRRLCVSPGLAVLGATFAAALGLLGCASGSDDAGSNRAIKFDAAVVQQQPDADTNDAGSLGDSAVPLPPRAMCGDGVIQPGEICDD